MVSFHIGARPTNEVEQLVHASMPELKPLHLCEITCIRHPDDSVSVLLRSKKQHWFKQWQRIVKQCFSVDLEEESVRGHNMAMRTLSLTGAPIIVNVLTLLLRPTNPTNDSVSR